jgi:acetate kinase
MNIFVLNCGSSSVKYKLYAMEGEKVLAEGRVERVWAKKMPVITHQSSGKEKVTRTMPILEHTGGHPGKV